MNLVIAFGALAIASLLYVFWLTPEPTVVKTPLERELEFLGERKEMVYEGLRDLQMEYRMGKLSDGDYQELKLTFQHQLAALLDEAEHLDAAEPLPAATAESKSAGKCPSCNADNPATNQFCGSCGAKLVAKAGTTT